MLIADMIGEDQHETRIEGVAFLLAEVLVSCKKLGIKTVRIGDVRVRHKGGHNLLLEAEGAPRRRSNGARVERGPPGRNVLVRSEQIDRLLDIAKVTLPKRR